MPTCATPIIYRYRLSSLLGVVITGIHPWVLDELYHSDWIRKFFHWLSEKQVKKQLYFLSCISSLCDNLVSFICSLWFIYSFCRKRS
jgi:hypothetical protein